MRVRFRGAQIYLDVEAALSTVDLDQLGAHARDLKLHVEHAVLKGQAVAALRGGSDHDHLLVSAENQ